MYDDKNGLVKKARVKIWHKARQPSSRVLFQASCLAKLGYGFYGLYDNDVTNH